VFRKELGRLKISFTTLATPELTGVEAIKLAHKYGYDGIDLRVSELQGELTLASTKEHIAELRAVLDGEGIALASLLAYNETGGMAPSSWVRMEESVRSHIELANNMQAEAVRIALGKKPIEMETEAYLEHVAAILDKALADASHSVPLLIQNHSNNFNTAECSSLIHRIQHPKLGLIVSTDHCWNQQEHVEALQYASHQLTKQLYIADIRLLDKGYDDVLPGTGEIPLHDYFSAVGGAEFKGWMTFKWEKLWRPALAGCEVALPFFRKYVTQLEIQKK
jgi:sugar phosphate isomerase/epimerase